MKILLACSAGMSTSLLEKSLNDYMESQGIEGESIATPSEQAKSIWEKYDVILLGPQVSFMKGEFIELVDGKIPVDVIPGPIYAMAKGKETFELAKSLLK